MKKKLIATIIFIIYSSTAISKDVIEYHNNGTVNWSTGEIEVTGYGVEPEKFKGLSKGRLLAKRAAIVDAYRNLAELTYGVRVTSTSTIKNLVEQNKISKTSVSGVIKGAEIINEKFESGTAQVKMKLKMGAKLMSTIMPKTQFQKIINQTSNIDYTLSNVFIPLLNALISPAGASTKQIIKIDNDAQLDGFKIFLGWLKENGETDVRQHLNYSINLYENERVFSGLIIDSRNVPELQWATHVTLVNEKGHTLYPNLETDYGAITRNRLISFEYSIENAINKKRVASKPLILKAKNIYKKRRSDLVLSKENAAKLMRLNKRSKTELNKGRVIIVVAE